MKDKINELLVDTQDHPEVTGSALINTEYSGSHPHGYQVAYTTRMILTGPNRGKFITTQYVKPQHQPTTVKQGKIELLCAHLLQLLKGGIS